MSKKLKVADKIIEIFAAEKHAPLIVFNAYEEEYPAEIYAAIKLLTQKDFSLAVIKNIDWNLELSPWPEPSPYRGDVAFGGGADSYLALLTAEILPKIKEALSVDPSECILGGYSLAGLFALYAGMKSNLFNGIMSASASMWYVDFLEYAAEHKFDANVRAIYFSLGDKESKTRNQIMATVETRTAAMEKLALEQGIETTLEMNPGNHFKDVYQRIGKGIAWLLADK